MFTKKLWVKWQSNNINLPDFNKNNGVILKSVGLKCSEHILEYFRMANLGFLSSIAWIHCAFRASSLGKQWVPLFLQKRTIQGVGVIALLTFAVKISGVRTKYTHFHLSHIILPSVAANRLKCKHQWHNYDSVKSTMTTKEKEHFHTFLFDTPC